MAAYSNDLILDAALGYVIANATKLAVCTAGIDSALTYANAILDVDSSGYCLGVTAGSSVSIGSPGAGSVSGRKVTVAENADITVLGTGAHNAERLVLLGSIGSAGSVLYVTDTTLQSLTGGNLVTAPAFDIELRDVAIVT